MAPAVVDLGRLDLVSTTTDLQLQVSSQAEFAPYARDGCRTNQILRTEVLNHDLRSRPWVYGASNYRLVLELRIEDGLSVCSRHEMADAVAAAVSDGEVIRTTKFHPLQRNTADVVH